MSSVPLRLRLPATSANLGPGFDAVGLAMGLYLTIEATPADGFRIEATGRDAELCASLHQNLILDTYTRVLQQKTHALHGKNHVIEPLFLRLHNEIPLGMGCGSSAAALLAGVCLANHFGGLNLSNQEVMEEACRLEGHPDNVAACWLGGMTVSAMRENRVFTATCGQKLDWKLLLALPSASLSTSKARALLPPGYTFDDTVQNIQSTALLVAAFSQNQPELLHVAMQDRVHQPFRSEACPLLSRLLQVVDEKEVYGVALSGAGPSVLLIASPGTNVPKISASIQRAASPLEVEVVETFIVGEGAEVFPIQ